MLAAFVERALAGRTLMIAGDGSQSRQFVYVEDLARGVVAALVRLCESAALSPATSMVVRR